ncbi:MAG: 3-deoxy-7-phosphoheptulonate synthase [Myxococcales bacterium]|nr:3-deoxy-7-phosphoheptulonate synthase [Myxococcales bacterium]
MFHATDDLRIKTLRPLIPPGILTEELPLTDVGSSVVAKGRQEAADILNGKDDRLLCVVGPCSIHDTEAALDYADRLKKAALNHQKDLCIIMRVYFEKPRTTVGWKGLINDPNLDGSFAINRGLRMARRLLVELAERGLPSGHEFLDTITPQFIADVVAWGAIGARTTESQIHRQLASGLSMPVGFKNGTGGSVKMAVDAARAAASPHHFAGVTKQGIPAIVATTGNDTCHVILRGSSAGPNYTSEHVEKAAALLVESNLQPRLMIDCSHGNSSKDHMNQPKVASDIAGQISAGSQSIMGVMIESHLVGGRQDYVKGGDLQYGQSITDACLAWDDTLPVLDELAAAVRARRENA